MASQSLYVAPLSSATGLRSYGLGVEPLLVHVTEELAGSCSIGDVVEVTGVAALQPSVDTKGAAGAARLQVRALATGSSQQGS